MLVSLEYVDKNVFKFWPSVGQFPMLNDHFCQANVIRNEFV